METISYHPVVVQTLEVDDEAINDDNEWLTTDDEIYLKTHNNRKKNIWIGMFLFIMVTLVVAVGIIILSDNHDGTRPEPYLASSPPSTPPAPTDDIVPIITPSSSPPSTLLAPTDIIPIITPSSSPSPSTTPPAPTDDIIPIITTPSSPARQSLIEDTLKDLAPFHQQAFHWLTEIDTWTPPANASSDRDYESLWIERYVMAVFYKETGGDNWTLNDDWLSSKSVCDWYSIINSPCGDIDTHQVSALSLAYSNFAGILPTHLGLLTKLSLLSLSSGLTGTLPTHLGLLTNMSFLSLFNNDFTGTLPTHLGLLTKLSKLHLEYNTFTGIIPTHLGLLTNLEQLFLYENQFSGSIPPLPLSLSTCSLAYNDLASSEEEDNCFDDVSNAGICYISDNCN